MRKEIKYNYKFWFDDNNIIISAAENGNPIIRNIIKAAGFICKYSSEIGKYQYICIPGLYSSMIQKECLNRVINKLKEYIEELNTPFLKDGNRILFKISEDDNELLGYDVPYYLYGEVSNTSQGNDKYLINYYDKEVDRIRYFSCDYVENYNKTGKYQLEIETYNSVTKVKILVEK